MNKVDLNLTLLGFKLGLSGVNAAYAKFILAAWAVFCFIMILLLPVVVLWAVIRIAPNVGVELGFGQYIAALVLLMLFGRSSSKS